MTSFLDQPELKYLGVAVFMVGAAYSIIKWVGRTLREQLGSGVRPVDDIAMITHVDTVPPALVKQAIERGLITPAQLAGMATMERQFVFASIKDRLASPADAPAAAATAVASVATLPQAVASLATTVPPQGPAASAAPSPVRTPESLNGAAFGLLSMPGNERVRLHCPTCGELLALPAFAPYVARCNHCGTRTAMREDQPGHYLLNVSPLAPEKPRGPPGI